MYDTSSQLCVVNIVFMLKLCLRFRFTMFVVCVLCVDALIRLFRRRGQHQLRTPNHVQVAPPKYVRDPPHDDACFNLRPAAADVKMTSPVCRRCAHDLAYGGCDGLKRPESIVRCDKCTSWFHVSCGQVGLGNGISCRDARDEALCRTCSRQMLGGLGKDSGPLAQKHAAQARKKRHSMLAFLDADAESGRAEGVFDLSVSHNK